MADDWDLYAVVRSCKASIAATATTATTSTASTTTTNTTCIKKNDTFSDNPFFINGLSANPTVVTTSTATTTTTATTSTSVNRALQKQPQPQPPQQVAQRVQNLEFKNITFPIATPQPIRPRKRKNQQSKMIRQMTQEELSNDSWAWRKYGQKPIKGSPYPRNYYKCSTTKSCPARKQVERSPTESNIYIVSCTGEHTHPRPTHRSSLAGSTRTKFPPTIKPSSSDPTAIAASLNIKPSCSSSSQASGSSFSPSPNIQDDDEDIMIPNEFMSEEIFKGFQEINETNGSADNNYWSGGGDDLFSPP